MIKTFYKKHKEWLTLFSSAFVGTLLGIGVTFGISGYLEQKEEEEVGHKFLEMTLDQINKTIRMKEERLVELQHNDSILDATLEYYPDRASEFPDSLAVALSSVVSYIYIQQEDDMTEHIFFNNIKTIEVFEDLSIVTDIRNLYMITHSMEYCIKQQDQIINKVLDLFYLKANPDLRSLQETIQDLYDEPKYVRYIYLYHVYTMTIQRLIEKLKEESLAVRKRLNLDASELKTLRKDSGVSYSIADENRQE